MVIVIVVGLVLLAGLMALFLSHTVWQAPQIVLMFFVMVATVAFFYLSARTLKTHNAWRQDVAKMKEKIKELAQQNEILANGGTENGQFKPGIKQVRQELDAAVAGRGRVWKGGTPSALNPQGKLTVNFADTDTAGIKPNAVLYAFEETNVEQGGRYMGDFLATDVAPNQITLEPRAGTDADQLATLARPGAAWKLYEIMPADKRGQYATLTDARIKELMPDASEAEFIKDGKPAAADDPAPRVWLRVKFLKDYTTTVKNGDSVKFLKDYQLKVGDKTIAYKQDQTAVLDPDIAAPLLTSKVAEPEQITFTFKPDDTGVFDSGTPEQPGTADQLIKDGTAAEVAKVYVRAPRDYARLFVSLQDEQRVHRSTIARIAAETEAVKTATAGIEQDSALRTKEIADLQADLQHFQSDVKALAAYVQKLDERYRAVVKELNETFARNRMMADEIAALQTRALQEVNQRTGAPQVSALEQLAPQAR